MSDPQIVASVLGADYSRLGGEVLDLTAAGVDRIQWDIMDGHFVPALTFGSDVVGACRPYVTVPFEAHLMVADPDPVLADFAAAGCETIIVHVEACPHLHRTLSRIRDLGARAGVAVNPSTSLDFVPYVLDQLDHVLVMTVNPGFGGQDYIEAMEKKVSEAREIVRASGRLIQIEVDGGISADTAAGARRSGAELLVAGSALLTHPAGKRAAVEDLHRVLADAPAAP
ncbi:ribulose-phosphate 3-epimerase [Actinomycetospora sp. NBRC 106378]|uniref:ribulose-phosphate 3-epimerase n=1 Tax=Actinomycetospora sp. NBRC 106378 TaxID=3032208 RepID=UPI0024A22EF6|nr:ribulose-phosphate 3-epimerase [Actinomycetospora sp. NBRC 106378]GLZ56017.1 ribulose-phosphate 3-epimerase [Actinomycetospora sp. NBRC 106378]